MRRTTLVLNSTMETGVRLEPPPALLQRRRRIVRLYLEAMLLLSLMFTLYIWQSTKIVEIKLRLQEIAKKVEFLETNNAVQKTEISKLQSLSRIEKVAKTELGMVIPKHLCYVPMPKEFQKQ